MACPACLGLKLVIEFIYQICRREGVRDVRGPKILSNMKLNCISPSPRRPWLIPLNLKKFVLIYIVYNIYIYMVDFDEKYHKRDLKHMKTHRHTQFVNHCKILTYFHLCIIHSTTLQLYSPQLCNLRQLYTTLQSTTLQPYSLQLKSLQLYSLQLYSLQLYSLQLYSLQLYSLQL